MNIFITGATGFLGKYIIEELQSEEYHLFAFGRNKGLGQALEESYAPRLQFIEGDFTDASSLENIKTKIDVVIHAGGLSSVWGAWEDFYQANVLGCQNILNFCKKKGVKRLVFISSPSIYAAPKDQILIREEEAPKENKLNYYIQTKLLAEALIQKEKALSSIILRPRGLFGLGDTSIIPRLLALRESIGIPLFRKGKQCIDITCVENVAYAVHLAIQKEEARGEVYNITNGEPMEFKDILDSFFTEMGLSGKYISLPYFLVYPIVSLLEYIYRLCSIQKEPKLTRYTLFLLRYSQTLSIDKAKRELAYVPKLSIKEGIRRYVQANRKH